MADTAHTAPAMGRTLRVCAPSLIPSWAHQPITSYAPAWRRRLAHALASKAQRRAELRARAFEVVASDRTPSNTRSAGA